MEMVQSLMGKGVTLGMVDSCCPSHTSPFHSPMACECSLPLSFQLSGLTLDSSMSSPISWVHFFLPFLPFPWSHAFNTQCLSWEIGSICLSYLLAQHYNTHCPPCSVISLGPQLLSPVGGLWVAHSDSAVTQFSCDQLWSVHWAETPAETPDTMLL